MFVRFKASADGKYATINLPVDEIGSILEASKAGGGYCAEIYVRETAAPNPYLVPVRDARYFLSYDDLDSLKAQWRQARTELEIVRATPVRPAPKLANASVPAPVGTN